MLEFCACRRSAQEWSSRSFREEVQKKPQHTVWGQEAEHAGDGGPDEDGGCCAELLTNLLQDWTKGSPGS